MKNAVRILCVAFVLAIVVTGFIIHWEMNNPSLHVTGTPSVPNIGTDPFLYLIKLIFSF
jgi:hypothetical protein